MIRRVAAKHFKGIWDAGVTFGPCTLLIGPNGGGKSNIFDAIRFLQGVGNGFTVREILDGKAESATQRKWEGLRGGAAEALWRGATPPAPRPGTFLPELPHDAFAVYAALDDRDEDGYLVAVHPANALVVHEMAWQGATGFTTGPDLTPQDVISARLWRGTKGKPPDWPFAAGVPLLTRIAAAPPVKGAVGAALSATCRMLAAHLADVQFLDLDVRCLRSYAHPSQKTLGDHGENFAAVAQRLSQEGVLRPWIAELLPDGIRDVRPFSTDLGEIMFGIEEVSGAHLSARSLSDGTLRFAALATALFSPTRPEVLLIEEIENGLHPSRLHLMVEMLLAAVAERGQIIATTHSPALLAYWPKDRHDDVLVVTHAEDDGGTRIVPLPQMPGYDQALAGQRLDELQIEGWTATPV
jgi:predicted ATPase